MAQISIPGIGAVEVPEFASEYTLNQLLSAISSQEANQIGKLGDIAQSIGTERSILQQQLAQARSTGSDVGASRRSQDRANKNSLLTLQQMKKQHKDLVSASSKQNSILPKHTAQILRTAASMVGGKGIGDALAMMPGGLGQGIALATKVVGEFADTQRRLTDVGFGLGTSILATTNAVTEMNLPISELERISGTHAVTLDYLNEVTNDTGDYMSRFALKGVKPGITAFAQLSHNVRKSMQEFGNYGFTVTEVNSYLAEYLESDRKRGVSANVSTDDLRKKFGDLASEVSAYAADTGRNRKDLMKAQVENMNRTDSATYSTMLRMKGEDAAADTFEKNLQLITNEMKSRYGDNADAMIDAWISAQTQGRGLEATEQGAEFMAMLGPAGAVLNKMAKTGELIDPAQFALLDEKLKESVGAYDTHNFAIIAKQKESLQMAAEMLMHSRDTSAESRALWKEDVAQKVAEGASADAAGAGVLKANEAMVKITTNIQAGLVKVTDTLVGKDGALAESLQKATRSVSQFTDAIGLFAQGDTGAAVSKIGEMLADNPMQFLLAAGLSIPGVPALAAGAFGLTGLAGTDQNKLAKVAAGENIKGEWSKSGSGIKIGDSTYGEGQKFKHQGTEYQVKDGKPQVTKAGISAIRGGVAGKAFKGIKGGGAAGIFSMISAVSEGYDAYSAEEERYKLAGGDDKASEAEKKAHGEMLNQIVKNALAKGGGGVLGGAAMGSIMGMMTGNPILMMLATGAGAIAGYQIGDSATKPDDPAAIKKWAEKLDEGQREASSLSNEEIKTRYVRDARQKEAQTDPTYLKLEAIRKLLEDMGGDVAVTAGATSSSAVSQGKIVTNSLNVIGQGGPPR